MTTLETVLSALAESTLISEFVLPLQTPSKPNLNSIEGLSLTGESVSSFTPPSLEAIMECLSQLLSEHVFFLAVFSPEDSPISPSQTQGAKVAELIQAIRQGTQTSSGLATLTHPICLLLSEMNAPIQAVSTFEKAQEGVKRNSEAAISEALLRFLTWKTIVILPPFYQPALPHLTALTNTAPLFYYFDPTIHQPDLIPEAVAQFALALKQGCQWETASEGKTIRVTVEPILSDLTFINASQALCADKITESSLWAIYFAVLAIGTGQHELQSIINVENIDSLSFARLHEALLPLLDEAHFKEIVDKAKKANNTKEEEQAKNYKKTEEMESKKILLN